MIESHHVGFRGIEAGQQPLDFFAITDAFFHGGAIVDCLASLLIRCTPQARCRPPLEHFTHHNAPGHDCQVSGQAALAAKMSQYGKIIIDNGEKDLAGQIINISRRGND